MFKLTAQPITGPLLDPTQENGAVVVFEGRVRNTNEGKDVLRLEYEAFSELAEQEGTRILKEASKTFPISEAACVHRTGLLELGEVAIRVEVAARHRKEAFEACMFIVDEAKRSVPIWKKEHYAEGASEWISNASQTLKESEYYDRQMRLPEVGPEGQAKLKNAKVLVVGAGGLGCPALMYLAAAGVGTLGLCEPDVLELGNLHRQVLYGASEVGQSKARLAAEKLRKLNPFIEIHEYPFLLTKHNAATLFEGYDLILDCTDSLETKFLLNDAAVSAGKTLIIAAIYQYEGQLFTVAPGGPCLHCLWPETPPPGCVGTCAEVGVLGVVPGVLGTLQALEAVKIILGLPTNPSALTLVDLLSFEVRQIKVERNESCPSFKGNISQSGPWWEVTAAGPQDLEGFMLVDIREADELETEPLPIEVHAWKPKSSTPPEEILALTEGNILLVCRSGGRTGQMASMFDEAGVKRVYSLVGGRNGLLTNPGFAK
jgi:adenylyltransferase/sulfurtransferase